MYRKMWASNQRTNLICVDSYDDGVLRGRFYDSEYNCIPFKSLSQFLISMESYLNERQIPQSYTEPRTFTARHTSEQEQSENWIRRGELANFDIRILFRQNTSWQGSLHWREQDMDQSFRSVLELVMLMDSALCQE